MSRKLTKEEFVTRAKEKHGNKYNYDKVEYKGNNEKVIITCPKHGDFPQTPHNHKAGQGCPECKKEKLSKLYTMTKKEFIFKAMKIHGDTYSYNNIEWDGYDKKVMITCQKHGDFPQTPKKHLRGQGCPKCNESHLETVTSILLEKHNIKYEPQKTFPWLKNKRKMHLDFFLPEYNIAIECQGIQHYLEYPTWVFTEESISDIKQRDSTKHSLCQEYGIPIYYIKYNDDIEEKINELISKIHEGKYR